MNNGKYAVIFDTNAYRQFVQNKTTEQVIIDVQKLKEKEKIKSIQAYGLITVGMEMLGHLLEKSNVNYEPCKNGVIAMGYHCNGTDLRMIPQSPMQVSNSLFGIKLQSDSELTCNMFGVITDLRDNYTKGYDYHIKQNTFKCIKNYLENKENEFSISINSLIEEKKDAKKQEITKQCPKITENILNKKIRNELLSYFVSDIFKTGIAKDIIKQRAKELDVIIDSTDIDTKAKLLRLQFPLSVNFFSWICHTIIDKNININSKTSREERWNWIWDYQIAFLMSNGSLDDREIIIVTDDRGIIEVLNDNGYNRQVFKFCDYMNYLN